MSFTSEQIEIVEDFMAAGGVPGVAVALVQGGEIVAAGGFGVRSRETNLPMTASTVSPIASLTKSFTGVATMMLVEQGKLALDEPVQSWLPEFRVADADASRKMTPRMFLCHKSGIGRTGHQNAMWTGPSPYRDRADLIDRLKSVELQTQPNEAWSYCNEGFLTVGHLIETQSGIPMHEFFDKLIFEPLGLSNTHANFLPWKQSDNGTTGYIKNDDGYETAWLPDDYTIYLTTGGIVSTAEDLARYQIHAMNPANHPLLSAGALEQTQTISMPHGDSGYGYGLGWSIAWNGATKVVEHGGGLAGVSTYSMMVPAERIGAVVITNLSGAGASNLAEMLIGTLRDEPLHRASLDDSLPVRTRAQQPNPAEREAFLGVFAFGPATVTISDANELTAQPFTPEFPDMPSTGLICVGHNRFLTLRDGNPITFLANEQGTIDRLLSGGNLFRRRA